MIEIKSNKLYNITLDSESAYGLKDILSNYMFHNSSASHPELFKIASHILSGII